MAQGNKAEQRILFPPVTKMSVSRIQVTLIALQYYTNKPVTPVIDYPLYSLPDLVPCV